MMGEFEKMYSEYVAKYIRAEKEKVEIVLLKRKKKVNLAEGAKLLRDKLKQCFRGQGFS